jgi:hypothetical protein
MKEHHEILGDTSIFARSTGDRILVSFRFPGGSSMTNHLTADEAQKLAWALLRGADFVHTHKVAEEA